METPELIQLFEKKIVRQIHWFWNLRLWYTYLNFFEKFMVLVRALRSAETTSSKIRIGSADKFYFKKIFIKKCKCRFCHNWCWNDRLRIPLKVSLINTSDLVTIQTSKDSCPDVYIILDTKLYGLSLQNFVYVKNQYKK